MPGPVRPPGPLARLPLDGPVDDARKAAPELFAAVDDGVTDPRWPGVRFRAEVVTDDNHHLIEYRGPAIDFASTIDARGAIERAWGPGIDATSHDGDAVVVWFDPAAALRASLSRGTLSFRRYLPVAQLLGPGVDLAIGATPAALYAAHPTLPPTDWAFDDDLPTVQAVTHDGDGVVDGVTLYLPYGGHPEAEASYRAAFEAKWGAGRVRDGDTIRYRETPIVIAAEDNPADRAWFLSLITPR